MPDPVEIPRVTPYYLNHLENKATMMSRGGWQRPLKFTDPAAEVGNTRSHVGLIDAHSMGKFEVMGSGAFTFLQGLITNDLNKAAEGRGAIYTCLCNEAGGIVDDVIIYRVSRDNFYFITNTLSTSRVEAWLNGNVERYEAGEVFVSNVTNKTAYLAAQGPKSGALMVKLFGEKVKELKYFQFTRLQLCNVPVLLARTGYTGEFGFELNFPSEFGYGVWKYIQDAAEEFHSCPVGGHAIQILRIEKAYRSHGTDMTVENNPYEVGLEWVINFAKGPFIGREALLNVRDKGVENRLVGFEVEGDRVLEARTPISNERQTVVGRVTSCCFSPTLGKTIALGFLKNGGSAEEKLWAANGAVRVRRTNIPFYDPSGARLRSAL